MHPVLSGIFWSLLGAFHQFSRFVPLQSLWQISQAHNVANFRQTNAWKEAQWCDRPVASPAGAWGCLQAGFPVLASFQNKQGLCTSVSEAQVLCFALGPFKDLCSSCYVQILSPGELAASECQGGTSRVFRVIWWHGHGLKPMAVFRCIGKKQEMCSQNMQKPPTFHNQNDKNGWSENISKLTMP